MTAGIPGAGIGGLFYLLSALSMPFRELWRLMRKRSLPSSRRLVKRHVAMALAISLSMWVTAWFLAALLISNSETASFIGMAPQAGVGRAAQRFLSYSMLAVSVVTLGLILVSVHVLRLMLSLNRSLRRKLLWAGIAILLASIPFSLSAQNSSISRAEAAFERTGTASAGKEYRAVLEENPSDSRALFRLARLLEQTDPGRSEYYFRRYIEEEPQDPWGYIVLAEFLWRERRDDEAIDLYADAVRIAPNERDAVVGRAQMLSRWGDIGGAIREYERWLDAHTDDMEASVELAREQQRAGRIKSAIAVLEVVYTAKPSEVIEDRLDHLYALAAPAAEPLMTWTVDSDGNSKKRIGVGGDFAAFDKARLGVSFGRFSISNAASSYNANEFALTARWRPLASTHVDAVGGLTVVDNVKSTVPQVLTTRVRTRTIFPGDAFRLELRFNRILLDATPFLVSNSIVRNEIVIRPDAAIVHKLRLKGTGSMAWIEGGGETNQRSILGGGLGWTLSSSSELSVNVVQLQYARPAPAGYFAPQKVQAMEAAWYFELEFDPFSLALDLGAGVERLMDHALAFGPWRPSLRGYAFLSYNLQPGRDLRLELDSYSTQAGSVIAPTPGWRSFSLVASVRWAVL
jgi:tetratricopeptide (TPR) repeat protein